MASDKLLRGLAKRRLLHKQYEKGKKKSAPDMEMMADMKKMMMKKMMMKGK